MINGMYEMTVTTRKHYWHGTIDLKGQGGEQLCIFKIPDVIQIEASGTCEDKDVFFEGSFEYEGETIDYKFKAFCWGNSLDGKAETSRGVIEIGGTRLSASTGDFGGADRMWAGRWSDTI